MTSRLETDPLDLFDLHNYEMDLDPEKNMFNFQKPPCNYYSEEEFNSKVDLQNFFSLVHFNCRSLYANINKINDYLAAFKSKFSVIAFSETWLNMEKGDDLGINGYRLFHTDRPEKRGGGVALYVDYKYNCEMVENMSVAIDDLLESVAIEIQLETNRSVIIFCVYRAQGSKIEEFQKKLSELIDILPPQKSLMLCGDFNMDFMNPQDCITIKEFVNEMYCKHVFPVITRPTRVTSTGATLLDNIFLNEIQNITQNGILLSDLSDHLPIFIVCQLKPLVKTPKDKTPKFIRMRTQREINLFRQDLVNFDWDSVCVTDVNEAYEIFVKNYVNLYNKNCPFKLKKTSTFVNKPWITPGLQKACRKKNKMYGNFVKYRTKTLEVKYKTYKNRLTTIMRRAEKDYYKNKLEKNKHNNKGIWKTLKEVSNRHSQDKRIPEYFVHEGKVINDQTQIANEFNSFFVNVGTNIVKHRENLIHTESASLQQNTKKILNSIYIDEITEQDILTIVRKSKNKTSTDCDGIDMIIVKQTIDCILRPLLYIFNLSFRTGIFPKKMKVAKIIPIFKQNDEHVFTNYRPVSVLSQFSKIIEKWFIQKLDVFLEKNSLLFEYQYGFRSNRSTSTALIHLTEEILAAIDKKQFVVSLFLDLQKAFDTVNHSILLSKLGNYGIRGIVYKWLDSYLNNRQQYVQINHSKSKYETVFSGIPQGSVIGPKLFILFINDIHEISKKLNFLLFADDTTVYRSGENLESVITSMEKELVVLQRWFDANKLVLNWEKTKCMIFGTRNYGENRYIKIDGTVINNVSEVKFLGVILDNKLSWKLHIDYISKKISKNIGILYKVKRILDKDALHILYCSLIAPYLLYCNEVWGKACKCYSNRLILQQKKVMRIINHTGPRQHTHELFVKSNILKFSDLVQLNTAVTMWKIKNRLVPDHICCKFKLITDDKNRRKGDFYLPYVRTSLRQRGFVFTGIKVWNSLITEIKKSSTISQLKRLYKKEFFENYKLF
uniref:Reverse transcriptase domain-containing protein n=1 Tax=Oryzias melastigma TaxID=30732 RepID=A0A3B3B6W1_ORYME